MKSIPWRKILSVITIFAVAWAAVYLIGRLALQQTDLSFRNWVILCGEFTLLGVLPELAIVWFLVWLAGRIKKSVLTVVSVLLGIGYLVWIFMVFLMLVFSTDREITVSARLIVQVHEQFLGENEYSCYRPVGLFFKEPGEPDQQDALDYLTDTYGRSFLVENGEIHDAEFSKYAVTTELVGTAFSDNLTDCIVAECVEEGIQALALDLNPRLSSGRMYLYFNPNEIPALAEKLYPLIEWIGLRTDYFDRETGYLYLKYYDYDNESMVTLRISFVGPRNDTYWQQYSGADGLASYIQEKYDSQAQYDNSPVLETESREISTPSSESAVSESNTPEEETAESQLSDPSDSDSYVDVRETYAMMIYDKVLAAKGYSCEVCYNAKGNLYLNLGSRDAGEDGDYYDTGTYRFTLVYDRTSKNGNCELYVLYKEHYTETADGSSTNDATAILDMYAVETATGKVVASGRQTWSDVGSAEYREITGE